MFRLGFVLLLVCAATLVGWRLLDRDVVAADVEGPLHGVVMAIKDQYDTADMRTTSGADVDYANDRPPADVIPIGRSVIVPE